MKDTIVGYAVAFGFGFMFCFIAIVDRMPAGCYN